MITSRGYLIRSFGTSSHSQVSNKGTILAEKEASRVLVLMQYTIMIPGNHEGLKGSEKSVPLNQSPE